ncbi:MAG: hypothetical protein R3D31_04380 [Hyphomicrobiaceae bacterium]
MNDSPILAFVVLLMAGVALYGLGRFVAKTGEQALTRPMVASSVVGLR